MPAPRIVSPTASGLAAMGDTLEGLIAKRHVERIAAEIAAQKAAQQSFENQLATRKVDIDAMEASTRASQASNPMEIRDVVGEGGRPVIRLLSKSGQYQDLPQFKVEPKPEATTDYGDFLKRFATSKGKQVAQLTAAEELEARKQWGQSDDRPFVPFPIVIPTATGPALVDRTTGVGRPVTDAQGNQIGPNPSQGTQTRIGEEEAGMDRLAEITRLYSPDFIGPVMGRVNTARQSVPEGIDPMGAISPQQAQFMAALSGLKNDMIRLITGAAVGVQEQERIMREIPDVTNRTEDFLARMEMTRKNRENLMARIGARTGIGQGVTTAPSGRGRGQGAAPTTTPRLAPGEKLAADGKTVLIQIGPGRWVPK